VNQGGKTVFLRSIGLAQLMMQIGLFVPAASFAGALCSGLFSHFGREEDKGMKHGKLAEELICLSGIVDRLRPDSILLFNESFASTYEHEASWLADQIFSALQKKRIRVFFVTHLSEFVADQGKEKSQKTLILEAERLDDGRRTFKMKPGSPSSTSHALDLFEEIFQNKMLTQPKGESADKRNGQLGPDRKGTDDGADSSRYQVRKGPG